MPIYRKFGHLALTERERKRDYTGNNAGTIHKVNFITQYLHKGIIASKSSLWQILCTLMR